MDEDLHSFGADLNTYIDRNQPGGAETLITEVNKVFTEGELSSSTVDTYLLNIFNKTNGILNFLSKILYKSEYKKTKLVCFELLYTLANNNIDKINTYLIDIIKTCSPVVRSSASAAEKEKSLQLIGLVILKGNLYANTQVNIDAELSELYEKTLFQCLHIRFDASSTVHEKLLSTIGVLAKKYPVVISNPPELQTTLLNQLNREVHKPTKSYPVITGVLSALSDFLESYPIYENDNTTASSTVYKCVKSMADPGDASRKVAFREALKLAAKHIVLLSNALYADAKWWHITLLKWFGLGVDEKKTAYTFLEAFYREMSNQLNNHKEREDHELFNYFMEYFMQTLSKKSVENYEMRLAIRGLGLIAESFKSHITDKEINKIFTIMSQFMENSYILNDELTDDQVAYLPYYVQALSFIIKNLPQLNNMHMACLQRVSILMIKIFPKVSANQHFLVVDAFALTLFQLMKCKDNALDNFLEVVIYQGVIWTCSHQIVLDAEMLKDQKKETITYKNYLPFWKNILQIVKTKKYENYEVTMKIRGVIIKKLFDELIKTLFLLINKLNLNTKLKNDDLPITNPEVAYEAVQTNDFIIFVNVVDFYQDILEISEREMFQNWINMFISQIIIKSMKHPLVSGFYKLLAACLKVCDELNYFEDRTTKDDINICFQSTCRFLQEVLWKVRQYKGDLQLACMHLILAAPVCTIIDVLPTVVPVFISLFDVGRSYLEIAHLGIDTLERWLKCMPQNDIEPFLKQVLPSLDSYLKSRSLGGNLVTSTAFKIRKTKQALNKRKVLVQTEPELLKLQQRILTFLGQLNDDLCLAFVNSGDNIDPVVWNKTLYLKITLPYIDNKLSIFLDKFVPRIIELAYSSDRKVRVAACELLHSIIMIILGTARPLHQNPTKLEELSGLMKAVAGPILKLGCNMDEVIQQLYAPLAHQLMHYYSHPLQMGLSHTQIIIQSLIDGITNPTDAALRDFAGSCIHEFVKWTIKQADEEDLLRNPINVKLWIRTISSFSVHPDPFKRLGAALIFNNIYTILREEHYMFNMFWLEILFALVSNLSLVQTNSTDDNNCVDQVLQALNHVQRGFVEKYEHFNKKDNTRRIPPGFEGSSLVDVAIWLLRRTGSINFSCRQKCMSMFCNIAPLVSKCECSIEKFRDHYINDLDFIICIYEVELLKNPTLNSTNNLRGTTGLFNWLQCLLCALDGYIFVINNHLIPLNAKSDQSILFSSLQFFLQFVQLQGITEVLNLMPENINVYTTVEKEYFNELKFNIVEKVIEFAAAILENEADITFITKTPNLFWNNNLWDLLCHYIFDPYALGFDIENIKKQVVLLNLLKQINNQCSLEIVNSLINCVSTYLINKLNSTDTTINIISLKQRMILKGLLLIQQSIFADKLNVAKYSAGTIKILLSGLAKSDQGEKRLFKLHRNAQLYWDLKLEIALKYKQEYCDMVDFICNQTKVYNQEQNEYIEYGKYFFQTFRDVIIKNVIKDYNLFCERMFKSNVNSDVLKIIIEILRYIHHNLKNIDRENMQDIVSTSLNHWDKIMNYLNGNTMEITLGIEFICGLINISKQTFYGLSKKVSALRNWTINLLLYQDPQWTLEAELNFKAEVFGVLPYVLGPLNEDQLRSALNPLKEKYLNQPPASKIAFLTTFKKLLQAVRSSRSIILLKAALDIYVTVPYTNEDTNLDHILHPFIKYVNIEHQLSALHSLYEMSFNDTSYSAMQRYSLAHDVLPIVLQTCHYNAFEQFYIDKIKFIITTIGENNTNSLDINHIMNRLIVYILIELLFLRIKTDNFTDGTCPVTKAAFNEANTDKKLVKVLFQHASVVCKKNYNLDKEEEQNIFRLYQCHCINAIISLISNTQKEITFYNWLFNREENKQDILWKHVINTNKNYFFDIDFDAVPSMKKVLINIRTALHASKKEIDPNIHSVKYIESQHLYNSTLSEDISQFDFSNSILRDQIESESNSENLEVRQEIQLESIDINNHECMASVCGLIQHIAENISSPSSETETSLPQWLKGIRNIMMAETTHRNVRIFFGKVIHNTNSVFKPYAKWFLAPIIKLIVDGCIGSKINFFITDLVIMLTSWSDIAIPKEDSELASKLLAFLMENAANDRKAIFKYNLENIKLVLEVWKPCLIIPYDLLQQKLKLELTCQKLDVGIHLVAAVLANNMVPWRINDLKSFLMSLTKIMKSSHRTVFQPCSEVLGMSLKYMSTDAESTQSLNSFQNYVHKILREMMDDHNKFAYCLQGIALHYPTIANQYLTSMISKLPHIGHFKLMYLRILVTKIEELHENNELHNIDFTKLLSEDNFEIQMLTLEMIRKSIQYLRKPELLTILRNTLKFINHSITICRNVVYDVFITAYDAISKQQDNISREIISICREALLQGLIDKELEIQEKIFKFWSEGNLPMDITSRLLCLLENMYKTNIEEYYIGYSVYLLLNTIQSTEEYNGKLFEFALHECDFQDYKLQSNWRRQHASIAPLFANTLSSQELTSSPMNPNILRATASTLEFQPTQAFQAGPSHRTTSHFTNSSSLLFSVDTTSTSVVQDGEFKDPNKVFPKIQVIHGRRFLKDKSKISRHYAYYEVKKSIKSEESRKDRIKQSERNVTIYRKYRIGDFPDIEITLASVIAPLQMLAKSDAVLAKDLYASIFTSLIEKMRKDGKEDEKFLPNINRSISTIFTSSTQFIPNTIGTFLRIALQYKDELKFDPGLITTVCQYSGLLSVGSLLLEEYLTLEDQNYATPIKKNKGIENGNILQWIKFAELHKEMEEWDVVTAVFLEKMNSSEKVLNAIEAESSGNWRNAQESYSDAIQEDSSQERKDFYYESYFKCFAALAEWNQLSPVIEQTVTANGEHNVWTSLWDDEWHQQKLLPWYLTAELRNILNAESENRNLFAYINESLADKEKLEYLKAKFGEELAILWLLQNDSNSANYYLNSSITNFLENWSHLNPLFIKLRTNKVLNLKNVIDIHLFLNTLSKIESYDRDNALTLLLKFWQENSNEFTESLLLSETRTVYRNQFISTLKNKLYSVLNEDDMQRIDGDLNKCKFKLNMNLVENAISQGNYYVARKYIKQISGHKKDDTVAKMQWSLALGKILYLKAQNLDPEEQVPELIKSWTQVHNKVSQSEINHNDSMCYLVKTNDHIYQVTQKIYKLISQNESLLDDDNGERIQELMGDESLDNVEAIWRFGAKSLQTSIDFCENEIQLMMNKDNLKKVYQYLANAYVKLAYCMQDQGEEYDKDFIICVLRAMKLDSLEGKQLFPCLLNKDIGINLKDVFLNEVSQIPKWMFLGWLPQLLANLGTTCIFVISDILIEIAKMYPQAIMYAYRLSKEKYKPIAEDVEIFGKQVIEKLDNLLLHNDLVDKFLQAVSFVTLPSNMLVYYLTELFKACSSKEKFDEALKTLQNNVYSEIQNCSQSDSSQGRIFKKIIEYESKIKGLAKGKFDSIKHKQKIESICREVKNLKYDRSHKLIDYSPWLKNFQSTELHADLEIPGQYTGEKRPLAQYHIKIIGFSPDVLPLGSLRSPIRLTILGNDAKEYNYLIKFGEDLRQDLRIEQIFNLMNHILDHDPNCHKRQLSICTFKVVPLNSSLGMIEWLNSTKEMGKFINAGIDNEQEKVNFTEKIQCNYWNWIRKALPRNENNQNCAYGYALRKYKRDDVILKFTEFVNEISLDVLRNSYWNISTSSESFYALRHKFIISYAVICVSQWLLGIGDRHLQNTLISLKNGQAIGIDFGHAFGTATQILRVPELVPFRLTPHILQLLQPLGEQGLFQKTMVHCLRAFRKNSNVLLATMNVFIQEPSVDWLDFAQRSQSTSRNLLIAEWYPKEKMKHARQKLEGANSTTIMIEELKAGHSNMPFVKDYIDVVKGLPNINYRATKEDGLSEEEQVKCLLDHSTDYNLLGRMYVGWNPWI